MRYAAGRKEQTRARIVQAAGRVFRRCGYHASGVDKVMDEAGLTPGGFYAHFASKESLLAESLRPAADEANLARQADREPVSGRDWVAAFLDDYLSPSHRDDPEAGCPLPALLSEVSRASGPVKESFEEIVRELAERIGPAVGSSEDRALAIVALCVGGLGLARSVADDALAERVLAACRRVADLAIDDPGDRPQPA
jgi:TetR/AcrR family transcriptional repressor of nem operon